MIPMSETGNRNRERKPVTFIPATSAAPEVKPDGQAGDTPAPQENAIKKFWREQVRPFLVMVFILFCMRSSLADWNVVPTGSMESTIEVGDCILAQKITLETGSDLKPGDIVVFNFPAGDTTGPYADLIR